MYKTQVKMDSMLEKGYRPSRVVLEFVKTVAPASHLGTIGFEYLRSQMSADDIIFARNMADWVRAQLRKQSGAVIAIEEAKSEVTTFFHTPQLFKKYSQRDMDRIYKDFRDARIQMYQGMVTQSGNAWKRRGQSKDTSDYKGVDYFNKNSPFQEKTLTKKEKIRQRFKKP